MKVVTIGMTKIVASKIESVMLTDVANVKRIYITLDSCKDGEAIIVREGDPGWDQALELYNHLEGVLS